MKKLFVYPFLDLLHNLITKCVQDAIFYNTEVVFIILTNRYSVHILLLYHLVMFL